jgi:hypothetical protein
MTVFEEQLHQIEQQEIKFQDRYTQFYRLDKILSNKETISWCLGYVISLSVALIFFADLRDYPSFNKMLGAVALCLYISIYPAIILQFLLQYPVEYLIHRYFSVKKNAFKQFLVDRNNIHQNKRNIQERIQKEKEQQLKNELDDFLQRLRYKKISLENAVELKKRLEIEKQSIHWLMSRDTKKQFDYCFSKINSSIIKLQSLKESTAYKTSVQPKSVPDFPTVIEPTITIEAVIEKQAVIPDTPIIKEPLPVDPKEKNIIEVQTAPTTKSKQITVPFPTKASKVPEEKTLEELFPNPGTGEPKDKNTLRETKVSVKPDYQKLNEHKANIGEMGELFVIEREKEKLIQKDLKSLSEQIQHVSKTDDSKGYDIISFFEAGKPKFIEVKTTTENFTAPFYLTEKELYSMKKMDNYFIYRVYNFDMESGKGSIFTINGKSDIEKYYQLEAASYRVSPKK